MEKIISLSLKALCFTYLEKLYGEAHHSFKERTDARWIGIPNAKHINKCTNKQIKS